MTGITELIDQEQYFVIHAPRQSGKTTLLLDLANHINHEGKYYALYCSLEVAQGIIEPEKGIPAIVQSIATALQFSHLPRREEFAKNVSYGDYALLLLRELSLAADKSSITWTPWVSKKVG